ncbi:MAG: hypothetical protein LUH36_03135 [Oscillospiraceae bacterium]|nr:hypothetical protein [Oscillospiraceae bacterium]
MAKKTLYYTDPLRDDFASLSMQEKPLPADYAFVKKNPLWRLVSFLIYYVLAVPLGWVIDRVVYGVRVHNRKALRQVKGGLFSLRKSHPELSRRLCSHHGGLSPAELCGGEPGGGIQ